MKVENSLIEKTQLAGNNTAQQRKSPSFKAGGFSNALNVSGGIMQWIENGGFLVSFLIQDGLGMTLPRVWAGFLRDKEVTGHYNKQEGFEVLGREGLTGPIMMAIAPAMMFLAAKFGRSTSVNSQLIKRFGNSLKEIVSKPEFNRDLLKNKDTFKTEFYKTNIKDMLNKTVGEKNVKEEDIKYILEQLKNHDNIPENAALKKFRGKSKYRKECISNIIEYINNIKYSSSEDLQMLDKLIVGSKESAKTFSSKNAIDAMIKYADDSITLNKHLQTLDAACCENIKNSSIAKRFITNISTMIATIGVLSILPKLYIRESVAPGAKTAMQLKEAQNSASNNQTEKNQNEITFKGKAPNKPSLLSKMGKFITKHFNEKYASELEYDGHNFTHTLMAGLSVFGLIGPRGLKAYSRAQVDENGKRDWTEVYEILIRDLSSSISVVFAVPMLTRGFVSSYENNSGYVLMHKNRDMSNTKKFLDLINPYSKSHVLTNSEIVSLYDKVNSSEKMINFCKFIDKNNGDLQKIISKSENLSEINLNFEELAKLDKKEKNKKITEFFENMHKEKINGNKSVDKVIEKLMMGTGNSKRINKIASFAKGMNSIPAFLVTFLVSPAILGWFIPRLTYANTRRLHAKKAEEKNKVNTAA